MSKRFRLGEQPDWAGTEDAVQPPPGFIDLLLPPGHADVDAGADLSRAVQSLLERGYALVPLPDEVVVCYSRYIQAFQQFSAQPAAHKASVALTQFGGGADDPHSDDGLGGTSSSHSPNQYHGFSEVDGLKEQFMMRCCSDHSLLYPSSYSIHSKPDHCKDHDDYKNHRCNSDNHTGSNGEKNNRREERGEREEKGPDMGVEGVRLFEQLDVVCRRVQAAVAARLSQVAGKKGNSASKGGEEADPNLLAALQNLLDPVRTVGTAPLRRRPSHVQQNGMALSNDGPGAIDSQYVLRHYISASILDCFHYFPHSAAVAEKKEEQFSNNHAAHTDSGLMTAVVCTDEPLLEVFDPLLGVWLNVELALQEWLRTQQKTPSTTTGLPGVLPGSDSSCAAAAGWLAQYPHRRYGVLFWGDSVVYYNRQVRDKLRLAVTEGEAAAGQQTQHTQQQKVLLPSACLHRVASAQRERYSVVYKQRTSTVTTPPRYQEDYILSVVQRASLRRHGAQQVIRWAAWGNLVAGGLLLSLKCWL